MRAFKVMPKALRILAKKLTHLACNSRGAYRPSLLHVSIFRLRLAVGALPREAVAAAEAAERHLAVLRLDCSLGLPFTVDEIIQGMVCRLRTHITSEEAAD